MFVNFLYNYNLTKDQIYLANELDNFLFDSSNFLVIQGSAGTGKTFLISKYIRYLFEKNINFITLAPTGRAAKIISEKSEFEAKTIHSEIYNFYYKDIDTNNDKIKIYFKLKDSSYDNTIFIIDESSMISDISKSDENLIFDNGKLLSNLIDYVNLGHNNKIILLGDEYQLPPINSKFTPALSEEYLEKTFNLKGKKIILNEIVRQKEESYILKNSNILKKHIDKKNYTDLNFEYNFDFIKTDNFIEKYNLSEPGKDIIIASTNEKTLEYSKKIRENLGFKNTLEVGDILLNTKNTYYNEIAVFNGEFFKVLDILNLERKDAFIGKKEHKTLEFYDLKLKNISSNETIIFKVLGNSLFSKNSNVDNTLKALYSFCINDIHKKRGLSIKSSIQIINSSPYFNVLHIKYGYAVTAHKAQGGEWERVFIDPYYYTSPKTKEYFQWLYTSITRAKKKVYIKDLPFKVFPYKKLSIQKDFTIKKQIKISYNLFFSNTTLQKLYFLFKEKLLEENFEITGVEHYQYQEVYYIKKNKYYLKVQMYYNKNYEPTKLKIIETTNENLAREFFKIFEEKNFKKEDINEETVGECIKIYVDGSYDQQLKKFGSGFIVIKKNSFEKYWKGYTNEKFLKHRNVSGEIFSILLAFEYAKNENLKCIEINYDYEGIEKWAVSLWKTNTELTKYYKRQYDYYSNFFQVKFIKIKSHSGNKYNEIADELAKKAVYTDTYNIKYDIEVNI